MIIITKCGDRIPMKCRACNTLWLQPLKPNYDKLGYIRDPRCPKCEKRNDIEDYSIPLWRFKLIAFIRLLCHGRDVLTVDEGEDKDGAV